MSDKMMVTGYTADNHGYLKDTTIPINSHMPFTGNPSTSGMPVTVSAFYGMLYHFFNYLKNNDEVNDFFQGVYGIEFSKASLFRLLGQQGCEYVRFNFAIPDADEKISLLAHGLDINRKPIGYDALMEKAQTGKLWDGPGDPGAEERGNGGETNQPLEALFAALKASGHPFGAATPEDL
ncbi:hypothetical protein [Chitinophaga flava]|uniref:Uncharacterized protein n=1 Tax=Chitinophaga flava TaxID=2259036 RepID=A0A365XZH0_9BACT|nr:hypothetical protein [Chitinophaga flava]RBL91064.1 hypothetical protein DF182_00115 [Chitinophaga flava]